jgi:hypothetical protein
VIPCVSSCVCDVSHTYIRRVKKIFCHRSNDYSHRLTSKTICHCRYPHGIVKSDGWPFIFAPESS